MFTIVIYFFFFFFNDTATTEIYTLSLHDALPIYRWRRVYLHSNRTLSLCTDVSETYPYRRSNSYCDRLARDSRFGRSEEHTSELQSQSNLVCRLLLEKKKNHIITLKRKSTNILAH